MRPNAVHLSLATLAIFFVPLAAFGQEYIEYDTEGEDVGAAPDSAPGAEKASAPEKPPEPAKTEKPAKAPEIAAPPSAKKPSPVPEGKAAEAPAPRVSSPVAKTASAPPSKPGDAKAGVGMSAKGSASSRGPADGKTAVESKGETRSRARGVPRDERKPWMWGGPRHHLNLLGTTGLVHLSEAGSGKARTFGLGAHGTWFKYAQYLYNIDGAVDTHTQFWGGLHLRVTITDFLEAHAGITATSTHNDRETPQLFQKLGDPTFGVKGFYTFAKFVTVGLDADVAFFNALGDVGIDWSGTSFNFDALSTFDLNVLNDKIPLRAHLNAGYVFDRTANLAEDIESAAGGCGTATASGSVAYQGCMSPIERTALGINRTDRFRWGIAIDAPLPYVSPIVEYRMDVPVNRQDFVCPSDVPGSNDSCMDVEGIGGMHQTLTIGARVLPPIEDLAIDVGFDLGLSGYAPTVHELAAEAPYRLIFGLSYNFSPTAQPKPQAPPPPRPLEFIPPTETPPPAHIEGLVHSLSPGEKPVAGAKIFYVGEALNGQVTDLDGKFVSYDLKVGKTQLLVEADGFTSKTFDVEVPSTGVVEKKLGLVELPKKGTIKGTVVRSDESPLAGLEIKVEGPSATSVTSGEDGSFSLPADAGAYALSVVADGFMAKRVHTEVVGGLETTVKISLRPLPKTVSVVIKNKVIQIKKKIQFKVDSAEIDPVSFALCDEIAALIVSHPELKLIEVQGHSDDRGKRDYNIDLSGRRADSVRNHLIGAGVEAERLTAKGFGPDVPLAPNFTPGGRTKNRRVEFHIIERTE